MSRAKSADHPTQKLSTTTDTPTVTPVTATPKGRRKVEFLRTTTADLAQRLQKGDSSEEIIRNFVTGD
jgi:uncharacterized protein (DUF433 family)